MFTYKVSVLAQYFVRNVKYQSIRLHDYSIILNEDKQALIVHYDSLENVTLKNGLFWNSLVLKRQEQENLVFTGINKQASRELLSTLQNALESYRENKEAKQIAAELKPKLIKAAKQAAAFTKANRFIRYSEASTWTSQVKKLKRLYKNKKTIHFLAVFRSTVEHPQY